MSAVQDLYPLSPLQQGMLFHVLYAPEAGLYIDHIRYTLRGELDEAAFERAWRQVVKRHDTLRSAFVWDDVKEPLQIVLKQIELPLEIHDWRGLPSTVQEARLSAYIETIQEAGFDLAKPPLMRLALIQLTDQTHEFIWNIHHLLLDGWSVGLLLRELMSFYEIYRRHAAIDLPASRPYRDYIAWLKKQDRAGAEEFWRQALANSSAPTSLAATFSSATPHGTRAKGRYLPEKISLSATLTEQLNGVARRHRLTLNTLVQGAWALLLHRYSGAEQVIFGAVVSGRPPDLPGAESMVGMFINTLPVSVAVPPASAVLPWLQMLQTQQFAARQYEYSSLIDIHGWSGVPRGQPLFESIVVFENQGVETASGNAESSLQIENIAHSASTTGYPLTVVVEPQEELAVTIYYATQHFAAPMVSRILNHLRMLLTGMAAGLEQNLQDLPLLSSGEERQLLREWAGVASAYPHGASVHELFAAQAASTPDAVALVFGDATLSYRELNERANGLAHHLQRLGVGLESPVGLCMERSLEMVIGTLAILKAGGAYLPLDPTYPAERLAFMLADAQPGVVLSQPGTQAAVTAALATAQMPAVTTLALDGDMLASDGLDSDMLASDGLDSDMLASDGLLAPRRADNPVSAAGAENLAYIMYTSGSTGRPKGTCIRHRSVVRLVKETNFAKLGADEVWLQFAPISFDAATLELWGSLLNGGKLVLFPPHTPALAELGEIIRREGVTSLWLTAGLFHLMVDERLEDLRGVRQLLAGGDVLSVPHVRKVLTELPGCTLINGYGPTENTTFTCCHPMTTVDAVGNSVSIGKPIANTEVYILDRQLRPVPVGVAGELYVGGAGLARAYLHRAALTAERFVPHPYSTEAGARLYRTGDLVRWLADGTIEFLGRGDTQVKVRGFRIELGEIETALVSHPAIRAGVVVARGDNGDGKQLVAYTVAEREPAPSAGELRQHLQGTLPDYMVPAVFVMLDALPLNANGKVDRQALPAPEEAQTDDDAYIAPRTPAEEVVAGIWAAIFNRSQVSVEDNFFALGGHSLLATQMASRLREAFGVDVPLRSIFEAPTLAALVLEIEKSVHEEAGPLPPPLTPTPRDGALPLSFAQQRLWFVDQIEPGNPAYNMPSAVRLTGALDLEALERSLNLIVARHESLRTTFVTVDGEPMQVVHPPQPLSLAVELCPHSNGTQQAEALQKLAAAEATVPFDLARGPLLRVRLLQLAATEHVIFLTMHHIISDEWSLNVLVRELATLYGAFSQAEPSPLPELPLQYADFARWQRSWLQGDVLAQQLGYWRQQLGTDLPVLNLPHDHPRPAQPTYAGAIHPFTLAPDLAQELKALSRQEGATLFMTLLAGLQILLYRMTGQADVAVGTDVANRNRLETEGLIGFFVNHLVLRCDLRGNPSFRKLLKQVRTVTLGAYAHQDLPFDRLVSALQPERKGSHTPLFQVLFVFGNPSAPTLELPGLTLSPLSSDLVLAKYDLTLFMGERAESIGGAWRYSTERFDAATIHRIANQFVTLLAGVVAHANERIDQLPLLTAAEQAEQQQEQSTRETSRVQRRKGVSRKAIVLGKE